MRNSCTTLKMTHKDMVRFLMSRKTIFNIIFFVIIKKRKILYLVIQNLFSAYKMIKYFFVGLRKRFLQVWYRQDFYINQELNSLPFSKAQCLSQCYVSKANVNSHFFFFLSTTLHDSFLCALRFVNSS